MIALIISVFGMNREMLECSDPVYCHFQDPKVSELITIGQLNNLMNGFFF